MYGLMPVSTGASNVNGLEELDVPTIPLMVTATGVAAAPPPAGTEHFKSVTEFHEVETHASDPSLAVAD